MIHIVSRGNCIVAALIMQHFIRPGSTLFVKVKKIFRQKIHCLKKNYNPTCYVVIPIWGFPYTLFLRDPYFKKEGDFYIDKEEKMVKIEVNACCSIKIPPSFRTLE